ncbi:divalent cation tolerance protein CutA [Candidatus Similichlamydia epinepheli]|uniref:divalent cation tolerance protein CutA n=1 Tax=Candidatus Similichlamydia epinepheli TaxID=1903953 RepID=UPI000D3CE648|nr:divalent-cation tolerance protein CutA [Candidatus Similichlamydia epinepheli]
MKRIWNWLVTLFSVNGEESVAYILVTIPSLEKTMPILQELIGRKLIACASFFPVTSVFSWEGKICEQKEVKILLKSRISLFKNVSDVIHLMSPYEVTEISLIKAERVDEPYFNWIMKTTHS